MNLFALTRNSDRPVLRIPMSAELQSELKIFFERQEQFFKEDAREKISFDGKYRPDDGECLTISDYDDIDNVHYAIANPMNMPQLSPDIGEFESIKAIFTGWEKAGKKIALIQSFDRRRVLSNRGGFNIFHSGDVYKKMEDVGLALDNRLAAILTDKDLDFFSFFAVRQIFDLSNYYIEATNDDLKAFSEKPKISINDLGEFIGVSDTWIRRKVVFVMQSGVLEKIDVKEAQSLAQIFKIEIQVEERNGKFVIVLPATRAELKKVLKFLDEDYFKSLLTNSPLVSSSKRQAF